MLLIAMGAEGVQGQSALMPDQDCAKFVERSRAVTPMTECGEQVHPRDGSLVVRYTGIECAGMAVSLPSLVVR
ncbi:MAG: hypothetical protein QM788_11375 [Roseateles sp.]|uniref:hypothetical protein n=1 Tax=Roseateles sp. TaxID=1971397 RepID=UPI0039EC68F6